MARRGWFGSVIALMMATGCSTVAYAQSCSADSQCPDAGIGRTYCSGNTVVLSRSVCAGSCQTVVISRSPCSGYCSGGTCIDLGARQPSRSVVPLDDEPPPKRKKRPPRDP